MIGPVVVGFFVHALDARSGLRGRGLAGPAAALLLIAPMGGAGAVFLAYSVGRFRTAARRTRAHRRIEAEAVEAAELIALGLAGGLSIAASHDAALSHAPPGIRPALGELVERMKRIGAQGALVGCSGPLQASSEVLAGAVASGAPALPALESHIRTEYHRRHAAEVEAARRLPIRLLLPLTLLVLPGFVLITVGPTIVDSLARLTP